MIIRNETLYKRLLRKIRGRLFNTLGYSLRKHYDEKIVKTFIEQGYDGVDRFLRQNKNLDCYPPVPPAVLSRAITEIIDAFLKKYNFRKYFIEYYSKNYLKVFKEIYESKKASEWGPCWPREAFENECGEITYMFTSYQVLRIRCIRASRYGHRRYLTNDLLGTTRKTIQRKLFYSFFNQKIAY